MKNIYHILVEQGNHITININLTVKGMITHTRSSSFIFKGTPLMKEEGVLQYCAGRWHSSHLLLCQKPAQKHTPYLRPSPRHSVLHSDQSNTSIYTSPLKCFLFQLLQQNQRLCSSSDLKESCLESA